MINDYGIHMQIYKALRARFGHRRWWPAETPFEVLTGAVLTQNTSWNNVETAISGLRRAGCMTPAAMAAMPQGEFQELIRPAGYYRQKAARLKRIAGWVEAKCGDDVDMCALAAVDTGVLREDLLGLKGIGPETADSILLYALKRPVFVVDAYTARVLGRHGLISPQSGYHEIQAECEANLPHDVDIFSDYHAQLVELGKRYCKRTEPRCNDCPLQPVLGTAEID